MPKIKIKTGIKALDNIGAAASKTVKSVGKGLEKVGQGNLSQGFGDVSQAMVKTGLDVATGGNKNLADGLSGGILTSAELAARGNLKDITRLGVTGGAALAGGPGAAMAANQVFSSGGDILQAGLAAGASGVGGMSWLSDIKDSTGFDVGGILTNLVNSQINPQSSTGSKAPIATAPVVVQAPAAANNTSTVLMVGGAALVGVLVVALLLKRK